MAWASILAPLSGQPGDGPALRAASSLARPFGAEVRAVFAPADTADLTPWAGEGFMGGVQIAALDSLRAAAAESERAARAAFDAAAAPKASFVPLQSPVLACLCMEARLCDVVVFGPDPPRGRGALVEAFQRILLEERRPVFVARSDPAPGQTVAVAWDGGREASAAAQAAIPWLRLASRVVILAAPAATPRQFDPKRLQGYLAAKGVNAEMESLPQSGEPGPILLAAARGLGAELLVAGAFGHPRFQQIIFGGATRSLLQAEGGPSLFLSH